MTDKATTAFTHTAHSMTARARVVDLTWRCCRPFRFWVQERSSCRI